jgi:dienelactone hydrolase
MSGQEPVISTEVSWKLDDTAMYATLTRPTGGGPHPAIVFVAGSGPTDRDWNSPLMPGTNGSARLLAKALARDGFVTLRYDKRAAGPHAQENMQRLLGKVSLQSHLAELAGAVAELAAQPDVDVNRMSVLTNSEGAIHALNYQRQATDRRLIGLVLTAPPGRPTGKVARSQVAAQITSLPDGDVLMQRYDDAIAGFLAGRPVQPDSSLPEFLQIILRSLTVPANLPFARELWVADPAVLIAKIPEPILVVIGKKDIQVDWQADGGALEAATDNRDNVTFVYPENTNHVLKYEARPREQLVPSEVGQTYNAADRILDPEALEAIRTWLGEHV